MGKEKLGAGIRRITLSTEASDALRVLVDKLVENGLKSASEALQIALRAGSSKGPMDHSNVAAVLMLAGAVSYGLITSDESNASIFSSIDGEASETEAK